VCARRLPNCIILNKLNFNADIKVDGLIDTKKIYEGESLWKNDLLQDRLGAPHAKS
jgi:hypothetical protein